MTEHISEIRQRFLSRRQLLQGVAAASALATLAPAGLRAQSLSGPPGSIGPGFREIRHDLAEGHRLSEEYRARILIRWGDGLGGEEPSGFPLDSREQAQRFGYNNDFIAYVPLQGSERGLLCVNHEYPVSQLMFPGNRTREEENAGLDEDRVLCEMAAVGHSVLEVRKTGADWTVVSDSPRRRRLTAATPIGFTGPAAGHARMRTPGDPEGRRVLGLLSCCAGGKTPWGTVLIAEENFGSHFTGDPQDIMDSHPKEYAGMDGFGVNRGYFGWARVDPRFDVTREPQEINRFGWVVELDPENPDSMPVKHTALGRFEHEGATVAYEPGRPIVVYSGDDYENQYLYRFVSSRPYLPDQDEHNRTLLSEGTLYCARFRDDGRGDWLPLRFGEGPLTRANGFDDQGDVVIDCRRAATLLGATPMDRPEDVETNPATGRVYVALTGNENKPGPNAANPKSINPAGHVLEILPPGADGMRDHVSDSFDWDILFIAGDPGRDDALAGRYGGDVGDSGWLVNPDNLAFDVHGRLWVATDGANDFGFADGLWCMATTGGSRATPRHFLACPRGAELCGPEFTPDGRTLFVAVQHPADEDGSSYDRPSTRWPDFREDTPPRPAVMAITHRDGSFIGD